MSLAQSLGLVNNFRATQMAIDPNSAINPNADNVRDLALQGLNGAQGRRVPQMQSAQIAQGPQNQWRNQQMQLGAMLGQQAAGQGPSVAGAQLRQGLEQAVAAQQSIGASTPGLSPAMAAHIAASNVAGLQQQTNAQAAQARIQEQMNAQQSLAGLSGMGRQQDLGLATGQAGLNQQTGAANLGAILASRGQNDAASQGYLGLYAGQSDADRQALLQMLGLQSGNYNAAQGVNAGVAGGNAAVNGQLVGGAIGAVGGVAGGMVGK